jgi:hypothetical protein
MKSDDILRSGGGFAVLGILVILSGCSYHDCGFTYHVVGRALDADELPLPQRPIIADLRPFTAWDERVAFRTDDEGHFSLRFGTGLAWGYMKLFGLIPLGSTKGPVPPRLENLYVAVQVPSGTWRYTELELTKEQQQKAAPAERWIDVGAMRISDR